MGMSDNIITLPIDDGRKQVWTFPDGTSVTMEVPKEEPPITVAHAIYVFSALVHNIHTAMLSDD
jgi:hypothetical protein